MAAQGETITRLRGRAFCLATAGALITVWLRRRGPGGPILSLRRAELYQRLTRRLQHAGRVSVAVGCDERPVLTCRVRDGVDLADLLYRLDAMAQSLADRPLTPREVRELLGISNRERLCWSKDGRLRLALVNTTGRGQPFSVKTFCPRQASKLASAPEIIRRWRSSDASCS